MFGRLPVPIQRELQTYGYLFEYQSTQPPHSLPPAPTEEPYRDDVIDLILSSVHDHPPRKPYCNEWSRIEHPKMTAYLIEHPELISWQYWIQRSDDVGIRYLLERIHTLPSWDVDLVFRNPHPLIIDWIWTLSFVNDVALDSLWHNPHPFVERKRHRHWSDEHHLFDHWDASYVAIR